MFYYHSSLFSHGAYFTFRKAAVQTTGQKVPKPKTKSLAPTKKQDSIDTLPKIPKKKKSSSSTNTIATDLGSLEKTAAGSTISKTEMKLLLLFDIM